MHKSTMRSMRRRLQIVGRKLLGKCRRKRGQAGPEANSLNPSHPSLGGLFGSGYELKRESPLPWIVLPGVAPTRDGSDSGPLHQGTVCFCQQLYWTVREAACGFLCPLGSQERGLHTPVMQAGPLMTAIHCLSMSACLINY